MSLTAPVEHEAANSPEAVPALDLVAINARLETLDAEQRVAWALEHGPGTAALSSSFGAQSAVTLHLLTRQRPDIPVILVDTGYLFPETYRFADELVARLADWLRRRPVNQVPTPSSSSARRIGSTLRSWL